jgi:hypothetical protein
MALAPKTGFALAALGLACLRPAAAQTTIYNFEISTANGGSAASQPLYQGQGALGQGGTVFNNANNKAGNFTFTNALDSYGNASTVSLAVPSTGGTYAGTPSSKSTFTASDPAALFNQYFYTNAGSPATFTVSNLPLSAPYTLYLYGATNFYNGSSFTVNGVTQTTAGGSANNVSFIAGPTANSNYVVFNGTTSAAGTITGTVGGTAFGCFNGLQVALTPAPEPSQSAALGVGLLGLAAMGLRARRRGASASR